jgi:spore coat protein U-like protein
MKRSFLALAIVTVAGVITLGIASTVANAATPATASIAVSATVQSNCIISAAPLAFGTYTGALNDASSTVTVTCTNTTPYDVGLDKGLNGASVTARQMKSGTTMLNYAIFSDTGRSTNWGSTIGTDAVHGTGSGSSQTLNVYGRISASQYVTPGAYADTITATLSY